jgi:hypothetical protein
MIPAVGDKYSYHFGFDKTVDVVVSAIAIDDLTKKQVFIVNKVGCPCCFRRRLFLEELEDKMKYSKL